MADKNFPSTQPTSQPTKRKRRPAGLGTIFHRKDGRYSAEIYTGGLNERGKPARKTFYGKTEKAVADQLKDALVKQSRGEIIATTRASVGEWLDRWLADYVKPHNDASTFASYETQTRIHIKPAIGGFLLRKLTKTHVQQFLNALGEKKSRLDKTKRLSPSTVKYIRGILNGALEQAVESRLISHNPVERTKTAKREPRKIDPVTPEAALALLDAVRGSRLGALFVVYLYMGLRCSEAIGLRWTDVSFEARTLRIDGQLKRVAGELVFVSKPKTASSRRTLSIPEPALVALREWRTSQLEERMLLGRDWEDNGLVFTSQIGTAIDRRVVGRTLDKVLAEAGLAHRTIHELRHAYATLSHAAGEDIKTISENLGHSTIKTTLDIYTHVSQQVRERAANRLAAFIGERVAVKP